MNERIRELVDKIWAEEYWTNPNTDKLLPAQLNRFAELIVRECMNVGNDLAKETFSYSTQPGDIFEYKAHAMEDVVEAIKEHLGVEE